MCLYIFISFFVTNSGGNYTQNGHITVEFPPSFASTPMREAWSWDNHLVNLTCRAESIPNATISWFLNGRNLETDYNIRMHAFNGESTITVNTLADDNFSDFWPFSPRTFFFSKKLDSSEFVIRVRV